MSTTFLLAPAPLGGPADHAGKPATGDECGTGADSLNILPFSLGSSARPYHSTNAQIGSYFQPRPAPAGSIGVDQGKRIATFRGRQLVGQHVQVPRGYSGWMIQTQSVDRARLAAGMGHVGHSNGFETIEGEGPSTKRARTALNGVEEDDLSLKRSPRKSGITALKQRVRGAGQTALARPKRAVARATRRMKLDSDEEDDDREAASTDPPSVTPKKRSGGPLTTPIRQSPRLNRTTQTAALPDITLHEATPLKSPLPPAPQHLKLKKAGPADFVIGRSALSRSEDEDDEPLSSMVIGDGKAAIKEEAEGESQEATDTEDVSETPRSEMASNFSIIPSPSTENDPPAFPIESAAPSPAASTNEPKAETIEAAYQVKTTDIDGPVRLLRPKNAFSGFTLWTPDTALAGYVEPVINDEVVANGEAIPFKVDQAESGTRDATGDGDETGPKVRPGWWAPGGGGEGGDGIVRALGEYIGLVEMLNEPVYLGQAEADGDEDEDG